MIRPRYLLPVIILSQFTGTSLWFTGNAVIGDLQTEWGLGTQAVGEVTSAVQLGFIFGTLAFALPGHRRPLLTAPVVFFLCSIAGAASNLAVLINPPVVCVDLYCDF